MYSLLNALACLKRFVLEREEKIIRVRRRYRLLLEQLEDRLTPVALTWTGGTPAALNNWNVATNWIPNQVPTAADNVTINQNNLFPQSGTCDVPANVIAFAKTITVVQGALTIDASLQVFGNAVVNLNGGIKLTNGGWLMVQAGNKLSNNGVLAFARGSITGDVDSDGVILALSGESVITGNLAISNGAQIATGAGPANLVVKGNFTEAAKSNIILNVQGNNVINSLTVTGQATLAGTLAIKTPALFVPAANTTFEPVKYGTRQGVFTTVSWVIGPGNLFFPEYWNNRLVLTQRPLAGLGTNTTVVASLSSSSLGQDVTLSATVSPTAAGSEAPTGVVDFSDEDGTLGSSTLNEVNGEQVAIFSTFGLALGTHSIMASYDGDSYFSGSDSAPIAQTVNAANYTVALSSSEPPSLLGDSVIFTATVTPDSANVSSPTGTVDFSADGTSLGSGTLALVDGVYQATLATSDLVAGVHDIVATFQGTPALSTSLNQLVIGDAITTSVDSSMNPSVSGQTVSLTATVTASSPSAGNPSGTVDFFDSESGFLGSSTLQLASDQYQAILTTNALLAGNHDILALYEGDSTFDFSFSDDFAQTTYQAETGTNASTSSNPSIITQNITLTATVLAMDPGSGTPTGAVTFYDGDSPPGSGSDATTVGSATLNSSGVGTLTTSNLSLGAHTIWAIYSGDDNFYGSASGAFVQTVNAPSLALSPVVYGAGRTVTVSGLVSDAQPQNDSVVLSGVVSGTASVNPDGTFSLTAWATGLGTVAAAALDASGSTFASQSIDLTSAATALQLNVSQGAGQTAVVTGDIIDADPTGLYVVLGGVVADAVAMNSDGTFGAIENASDVGTIDAVVVDANGNYGPSASADLTNVAPAISMQVTYGAGQTITLSGQVVDEQPYSLQVTFTGVINGWTNVNSDGTFSYTTQAQEFGTVEASTMDPWGAVSNTASVDITSAASALRLSVAQAGFETALVSGEVVDTDPTGLSLTLTGVANDTIPINSDGTFSVDETVSTLGTVDATTVDPNGLVNLSASAELTNTPPVVTMAMTYGAGRSVTLSGQVTDEVPQDDIVTFSGVVNGSVFANPDGSYSFTAWTTGPGTISASTVDDWSAVSNVASVAVDNSATALQFTVQQAPAPETVYLEGAVIDTDPTGLSVQFSGAYNGSVPVAADGTYMLTVPDAEQGTYYATVIDPTGQVNASSSAEFSNQGAQITSLQVNYLGNQLITLSGQVADQCPGGLVLTFTGVVQATATVNSDGTFSLTTQPTGLGTVEAATTDWWGVPADPVDVDVAPEPPSVTVNVTHDPGTGNWVTISGQVSADYVQGMPIFLGGAVQATAYADANGNFSLTVQAWSLDPITATTQDDWGQNSNTAVTQLSVNPPSVSLNGIVYVSGNTVVLSGNVGADDPGNLTVTFTGAVNAQVQTDADGNFTLTAAASNLSTIQATATDIWGQTSDPTTLYMYVAPPSVYISSAVITPGHTATITGQVVNDDPADTTFVINTPNGQTIGPLQPDANGNFTFTSQNLILGDYTVVATDQWGQSSDPADLTLSTAGPQITLSVTYGSQRSVTFAGQLTDVDVGQLYIYFSGAASGFITTFSNGTFYMTTVANYLGAVTATTTDLWGLNSNQATVFLTSQPPVIDQFTATSNGNNVWTFAGHVNAPSPAGMTVSLGGLSSLVGKTAQVNANGSFSIQVQLAPGETGTATAQTLDWWGQSSNVALVHL